MAQNTNIEWCDSTFNPWIGCTRVSPACDDCYAARSTPARTLGVVWGPHEQRRRTSDGNWALPLRWEKQHAEFAAQHGRRRRVFCASLADVFDNDVPIEWRRDLFNLILSTPHLDWLLLTKRIGNAARMIDEVLPENMKALPAACPVAWPWPNVWLGATVVTQAEADRDIPKLLATPAEVRFLSIEPMLGPINLERACDLAEQQFCAGTWEQMSDPVRCQLAMRHGSVRLLDWVIAGGESGPQARPMHPDWVRGLQRQCDDAGVPFLFKQWGEWAPYDRGRTDGAALASPNSLDAPVQRFGKKLAGRLLDGRQHDGFPEVAHA